MLSAAEITFNYNEAKKRAAELEEAASGIERAERELETELSAVSAKWQGDSATGFKKKGVELADRLKTSAAELRSTASAIRKRAKEIFDIEMRNIELLNETLS